LTIDCKIFHCVEEHPQGKRGELKNSFNRTVHTSDYSNLNRDKTDERCKAGKEYYYRKKNAIGLVSPHENFINLFKPRFWCGG